MTEVARLVRHREGGAHYQYPTSLDVPPVSLIRGGRDDLAEHGRVIDPPVTFSGVGSSVGTKAC